VDHRAAHLRVGEGAGDPELLGDLPGGEEAVVNPTPGLLRLARGLRSIERSREQDATTSVRLNSKPGDASPMTSAWRSSRARGAPEPERDLNLFLRRPDHGLLLSNCVAA